MTVSNTACANEASDYKVVISIQKKKKKMNERSEKIKMLLELRHKAFSSELLNPLILICIRIGVIIVKILIVDG